MGEPGLHQALDRTASRPGSQRAETRQGARKTRTPRVRRGRCEPGRLAVRGHRYCSHLCLSVFICGFKMMTTRQTLALLRAYESRNVTFIEGDGSWPIIWERANGVHVWDANGRKYLDLTAAFGVATTGHANPRVVKAGQEQMATLLHAMGDVHPHALKAQLARELSRITFGRWLRKSKVQSLKSKVVGLTTA